jgi:hypothetical protein
MSEHVLEALGRGAPGADAGRTEPAPDLAAGEVVEVPLLLPGWQVSALERAAHRQGLTAGEMVRHLLRDFFAGGLSGEGPSCKIKAI